MANFQSTFQEIHQTFSMHIAEKDLSGGSFLAEILTEILYFLIKMLGNKLGCILS